MDANASVGSSWSAGNNADTRCPRELSVCLRHVGGGAFVPANDKSDVVSYVVKRVKHRKVALARNAEDGIHTLNAQSIYEQLGACSYWIIVRPHFHIIL